MGFFGLHPAELFQCLAELLEFFPIYAGSVILQVADLLLKFLLQKADLLKLLQTFLGYCRRWHCTNPYLDRLRFGDFDIFVLGRCWLRFRQVLRLGDWLIGNDWNPLCWQR